MKLVYNAQRIITVVPDGKSVGTSKTNTVFEGTKEEIDDKIEELGLPLPRGYRGRTPGEKQRKLFTQTAQTNPALVAPYLVLDAPLSAINAECEASGDYTAAKTLLGAVVTTTKEQATVKAALLACYP
jgi:hypothetical protein